MANILDRSQTLNVANNEFLWGDDGSHANTRTQVGEFFRPSIDQIFVECHIWLAKANSPSDGVQAEIYNATISGSTLAVGSLIATSSNTIAASSLPVYSSGSCTEQTFTFAGSNISASNYYFIAVKRTGTLGSTDDYAAGASSAHNLDGHGQSSKDASSWVSRTLDAGSDLTFKTYFSPPAPTSVSPNTGVITGGTSVTVTGTGFVSGDTVTFGGNAATGIVVTNSTTITCLTPAHAAGAVSVVVTDSNGNAGTLASGFTYFGYDTSKNTAQSLALSSTNADILTAQIVKTDVLPASTSVAYSVSGDNGTTFQAITPVAAFSEVGWSGIGTIGQVFKWKAVLTGTTAATPVVTELDSFYAVGLALDATTKVAAQAIVAALTGNVQRVDIYAFIVGSPGNITCRIESDSSNSPSGTLQDPNATVAVSAPAAGTWAWLTFNFPAAFSLSATTKYWIRLNGAATLNSTNKYLIRANNGLYTAGVMKKSSNSGSTYSGLASGETMNFQFFTASGGNFLANATIDYTARYL